MIEKLRFLVRYWDLLARTSSTGALTHHETLELHALMHVLNSDAKLPPPSIVSRKLYALPAALLLQRGAARVELRQVNASGFVIAAARPLPLETLSVLRVSDPETGHDYTFPCRLAWKHDVGTSTIALTIDGRPSISAPESLSRIAMNPKARLSLLA